MNIIGDIFRTRADIEVNRAYIFLGQSEIFRDDELSAATRVIDENFTFVRGQH